MTEADLQIKIIQFFRKEYPNYIIFSVPNELARNNAKYRSMGVLGGVSDIIVLMNNKTLFIELKHGKNKQTPAQEYFENKVNTLGFDYFVVYDIDQFKNIINENNHQ